MHASIQIIKFGEYIQNRHWLQISYAILIDIVCAKFLYMWENVERMGTLSHKQNRRHRRQFAGFGEGDYDIFKLIFTHFDIICFGG